MRSDKQLLILLILLVMTTAVGLVFFQQEPGPKGQENTAVLVTNFRMGEVQGLVLKNEAGTMALINTPGGVILEGEEAHPYAQDKLKTLIYTVSHLTARRQLDSDSTRSEEFGTENPLAQASILLPESTIRLRLGRQNPISGEYYLSVEGRDSFYMIDSETAGLMLQTARDMREFSLYPPLTQESISDIIQIKITNRKGSFAIGPMPSASGSNFFGLL